MGEKFSYRSLKNVVLSLNEVIENKKQCDTIEGRGKRQNAQEWARQAGWWTMIVTIMERSDINLHGMKRSNIDRIDMSRCAFDVVTQRTHPSRFEYLPLFDRYQAFSRIDNARLVQLFLSKRHLFVVGSLRCGEMYRLLNVNNEVHLKYLTDLIDTLVLDDSLASSIFLEHISKRMDVTQPLHCRLPSMTQLIVFKANDQCSQTIRSLLLPINFCNHPLRRVHLVFQRPNDEYSAILLPLMSNRIWFHTMILEVENGTLSDWLS